MFCTSVADKRGVKNETAVVVVAYHEDEEISERKYVKFNIFSIKYSKSTIFRYTPIVQLVEHRNFNPSARGFESLWAYHICRCSLAVKLQPSKLVSWVRLPSSAPIK